MDKSTEVKKQSALEVCSLGTGGEFGLIQGIAARFAELNPEGTVGIGDDCAAISWQKHETLLVTTDLLLEGVHFIRDQISAEELAEKALSVNLSDLAAKGAQSRFAFLSIALPREWKKNEPGGWLEGFFVGLHRLCKKEGVALLGGDTSASDQGVVINLTLIGVVTTSKLKLRSDAQLGDLLCVTGTLGDSRAGLKILLDGDQRSPLEQLLVDRHHRPRAHLSEGQWLAAQPEVHAMIDLSDGLQSDIQRILEASSRSGKDCAPKVTLGAEVWLDALPLSHELSEVCLKNDWDPAELAACGGEDYCLLFTVKPEDEPRLKERYQAALGQGYFVIGKLTADSRFVFLKDGRPHRFGSEGFRHF